MLLIRTNTSIRQEDQHQHRHWDMQISLASYSIPPYEGPGGQQPAVQFVWRTFRDNYRDHSPLRPRAARLAPGGGGSQGRAGGRGRGRGRGVLLEPHSKVRLVS